MKNRDKKFEKNGYCWRENYEKIAKKSEKMSRMKQLILKNLTQHSEKGKICHSFARGGHNPNKKIPRSFFAAGDGNKLDCFYLMVRSPPGISLPNGPS